MGLTLASLTPIDWDQWRADYDTMTFEEHRAFNQRVAEKHPVQQQFDADACAEFLLERKPAHVVELGGWDGALATQMLGAPDADFIESWTNYDITEVPQVCDDPRYERMVLDCWPWEMEEDADCLIASHVFEHMKLSEIENLIEHWNIGSVYVDAPILSLAQSWFGYEGTHIIDGGSSDLIALMDRHGFDCDVRADNFVGFFDRR